MENNPVLLAIFMTATVVLSLNCLYHLAIDTGKSKCRRTIMFLAICTYLAGGVLASEVLLHELEPQTYLHQH